MCRVVVHSCGVEQRPCLNDECRHHLAFGEGPKFAKRKDKSETCSMDVAYRGGETLETVGNLMGLTRERIRQLEERAVMKLHQLKVAREARGETR